MTHKILFLAANPAGNVVAPNEPDVSLALYREVDQPHLRRRYRWGYKGPAISSRIRASWSSRFCCSR